MGKGLPLSKTYINSFTLLPVGGFYSPGLYCPSGYTGVCSATAGGSSDWPVEYSMLQGETALGCCPTYVCTFRGHPLVFMIELASAKCVLVALRAPISMDRLA